MILLNSNSLIKKDRGLETNFDEFIIFEVETPRYQGLKVIKGSKS
jgi:hypothetical protein